ncbi:MAG: hypothetical protein ACRC5M_06665 [Anaeroplasmataceae bacterium]
MNTLISILITVANVVLLLLLFSRMFDAMIIEIKFRINSESILKSYYNMLKNSNINDSDDKSFDERINEYREVCKLFLKHTNNKDKLYIFEGLKKKSYPLSSKCLMEDFLKDCEEKFQK